MLTAVQMLWSLVFEMSDCLLLNLHLLAWFGFLFVLHLLLLR